MADLSGIAMLQYPGQGLPRRIEKIHAFLSDNDLALVVVVVEPQRFKSSVLPIEYLVLHACEVHALMNTNYGDQAIGSRIRLS